MYVGMPPTGKAPEEPEKEDKKANSSIVPTYKLGKWRDKLM